MTDQRVASAPPVDAGRPQHRHISFGAIILGVATLGILAWGVMFDHMPTAIGWTVGVAIMLIVSFVVDRRAVSHPSERG